MTTTSAETDSRSAWRHYFGLVRDWPANGNSPYSPFFCLALLIGIALIIEVAR